MLLTNTTKTDLFVQLLQREIPAGESIEIPDELAASFEGHPLLALSPDAPGATATADPAAEMQTGIAQAQPITDQGEPSA